MTRRTDIATGGMALALALLAGGAQAAPLMQETQTFSVKTGATRVIYTPGSAGAALTVINPQSYPMLVQSAVLKEDKKTKAPFIVTPPLFRLDGHQQSRLRVVGVGDTGPADRESLNWLCLTGIPPEPDSAWAQDDKAGKAKPANRAMLLTQMRVSSCLKLLVRPAALKGTPVDAAPSMTWHLAGTTLTATNPTPFFMNLKSVTLGGRTVSNPGYVPPMGHLSVTVPAGAAGGDVAWKLVTDYGGDSREFRAALR